MKIRKIINDIEMDREEFLKLWRGWHPLFSFLMEKGVQ